MFSNNTIVAVIKLLDSHDEIDEFLLIFGLQDVSERRSFSSSKRRRRNEISEYLIINSDMTGIYSNNLLYDIVENLVNKEINRGGYYSSEKVFVNSSDLYRALRNDGYCIRNGELSRQVPEECDINKKESYLETILSEYNFDISLGHLRQAKNTHKRGEWAAANSQIRTFVESIFNDIAQYLVPDEVSDNSYQNRRLLSNIEHPIFIKELNEWTDNGTGFINGFWKRLCPEGSHPGLSDEEDSTFRLHLAYIVISQLMIRLENIGW